MTALLLATAILAPTATKFEESNGRWRMLRGGQPYVVRGVGGDEDMEGMRARGINSVRTWGADNLTPILGRAYRNGLTVCVGFWMGHREHGFNYQDQKSVDEQFARAEQMVEAYKDHPAVLMWAVGNEMELGESDPEVFEQIERIAKMIKAKDPNHPVISVVADMWEAKMQNLLKYCPSLDGLGVNSYGGLPTLAVRMTEWKRPYFITEYAFATPDGAKTSWDRKYEPTSTEKARMAAANFADGVQGHPNNVLGGYYFHWSKADTGINGWFNAYLQSGERLGITDEITKAYLGHYVGNRAPVITAFEFAHDLTVAPEAKITYTLRAYDPEGQPMTWSWYVYNDSGERFVGDFEQRAGLVEKGTLTGPGAFPAPRSPGIYRAVIVARDGSGGAATATLPFRVTASD